MLLLEGLLGAKDSSGHSSMLPVVGVLLFRPAVSSKLQPTKSTCLLSKTKLVHTRPCLLLTTQLIILIIKSHLTILLLCTLYAFMQGLEEGLGTL